jgi:hypothetical protein
MGFETGNNYEHAESDGNSEVSSEIPKLGIPPRGAAERSAAQRLTNKLGGHLLRITRGGTKSPEVKGNDEADVPGAQRSVQPSVPKYDIVVSGATDVTFVGAEDSEAFNAKYRVTRITDDGERQQVLPHPDEQ